MNKGNVRKNIRIALIVAQMRINMGIRSLAASLPAYVLASLFGIARKQVLLFYGWVLDATPRVGCSGECKKGC